MSGVQQLHEILTTSGLKNLTVSRRELPDDDHLTAPIAGFYTGLRVVFRSWFFRIDDADDPQELYWRAKDHYRKLRELYGFDVAIPEGRLERIARRLLDVNETVEAVCVLHELVTAYPASASGYDLLAAAHERRTLSTTRAQ